MKDDVGVWLDELLRNKHAHTAYETFIEVIMDEGHAKSLIWVALEDAWMISVIHDLQRLVKIVGMGRKRANVLKTRYNAVLPIVTANLQA